MADNVQARWALVLPYREHMLAVARRRCTTEEDAEDCVHEAMLRVAQFEGLDPARVGALLTSVTTRLVVDMHRARERARRHLPRLVSVPAQQPAPDEAALDSDEAAWLAAQVQNLPEREREVFRQRAAGYSAGEAAARLSLSYKAVESAFTRARGRMRMWAGAGSLLLLDYLRRLRQRPSSAALASLAIVSVGLIIATSLPGRPSGGDHRASPGVSAPHGWASEEQPRLVSAQIAPADAGHGRAPLQPSGAQHRTAGPTPPPSDVTRKPIFHKDVPGGPNGPIGIDLSSYDNPNGNFVNDVITCIEQQPDFSTIGCPPPQ